MTKGAAEVTASPLDFFTSHVNDHGIKNAFGKLQQRLTGLKNNLKASKKPESIKVSQERVDKWEYWLNKLKDDFGPNPEEWDESAIAQTINTWNNSEIQALGSTMHELNGNFFI